MMPLKLVKLRGVSATFAEHAKSAGVCRLTFLSRYRMYKKGRITLKQLFSPPRGNEDWSFSRKLTYKGVTKSISGWAKHFGLSYAAIYARVAAYEAGRRSIDWVFCPSFVGKIGHLVTYKGETMNVSDWSRRTGVSRLAISRRLAKGATPAQAFQKGDWRSTKAVAQPAHGNHTRRKLAALGIFA